MDFCDMAQCVDEIVYQLQTQQHDPELEGEVGDLIRELSTISNVLYTLYPSSLRTLEERKWLVRKLWAKANNERGRL